MDYPVFPKEQVSEDDSEEKEGEESGVHMRMRKYKQKMRRSELDEAVCYAEMYGRHLEDLEIRFSHPLNSFASQRIQQAQKTGRRLHRTWSWNVSPGADTTTWCAVSQSACAVRAPD
ncbi:hypothetical protein UPYG_G00194890 [Umbra pygmaea]|uniref:Uncharacterized protein n=1 Tax=Umbra pygmaea TaxID=75934 RepID=A0ABD0WGX3_UMBPY